MRLILNGLAVVLCKVFGVRVTDFIRSEAEQNEIQAGYPSGHLKGWFFDVGAETSAAKRAVMAVFCDVEYHEKGTAPHYHCTVKESVVWGVTVLIVALVGVKWWERGKNAI